MSETEKLRLFKHNEPLETNENKFDIDLALNQNWDKIDKFADTVDDKVTNLQEQNTKLESQIKKDRENMINLEVEGQSIHIENSSDLEGQLEVLGNVEQDTSIQGKNKLNLRQSNYTVSEVNVIKNNSILTLNGKTNIHENLLDTVGDMYKFIYLGKFKAGTYRFSKFIISGKYFVDNNIGAGTFACYIRKKDKTLLGEIGGRDSGGTGVTITLQEDTDLYIQIFCNSGAVFENYVLGFQLEEGDKTTDFEQFIPDMPSPEYPSEIRAVGDNINLLENTTKTQTVNGVTFTVNEDGTVTANGTATNASYINVNTFSFVKDIDYILSGCPNGGSNSSYKMDVLNASKEGLADDYGKGGAIKVGTNQTGIIRIRIANGYKANNLIFKPKLEKGTVATSYSPYGQGSVEIKKQNKNLLENLVKSQNINGIKVIRNEDKSITLNGTATNDIYLDINKENTIILEENENYTMSIGINLPSNLRMKTRLENKAQDVISIDIGESQKSYIATKKQKVYTYIQIIQGAILNNLTIYPMITKGTVTTKYEEHQEQTKILPIQQPMLEGDYLDKVNKKEIHGWEKKVLNGTEKWINTGNTKTEKTLHLGIGYANSELLSVKINCKCENLKVYTADYLWNNEVEGIAQSKSQIIIRIGKEKATNTEEFKTFLSKNNITVYCKSVKRELPCTPEQTKVLDELNNFQTYKPVTNITTDSIAKLKLKYIADTKTYIDNKTSNLEQQVSVINQLLSTTKTSSVLLDNLQTDIESEVI